MSQKELEESLEKIQDRLKYDDDPGRATALSNLKKILSEHSISSKEVGSIVSLLADIYHEANDILITDVIEILCLIGKQDFKAIVGIFPELRVELTKKNRYHIAPLLELISRYISTDIPEMEEVTRDLLENGLEYFNRSYLKQIFISFWAEVANQGFGFFAKYQNQISVVIPKFKEGIPEIGQIFVDNLAKYREFLVREDNRKKEIARQVEKDREHREKMRKKRLELMENMREKLDQEEKSPITNPERPIRKINPEEPVRINNSEEPVRTNNLNESPSEPKSPLDDVNPNFISFSNLGLKKKEKKND